MNEQNDRIIIAFGRLYPFLQIEQLLIFNILIIPIDILHHNPQQMPRTYRKRKLNPQRLQTINEINEEESHPFTHLSFIAKYSDQSLFSESGPTDYFDYLWLFSKQESKLQNSKQKSPPSNSNNHKPTDKTKNVQNNLNRDKHAQSRIEIQNQIAMNFQEKYSTPEWKQTIAVIDQKLQKLRLQKIMMRQKKREQILDAEKQKQVPVEVQEEIIRISKKTRNVCQIIRRMNYKLSWYQVKQILSRQKILPRKQKLSSVQPQKQDSSVKAQKQNSNINNKDRDNRGQSQDLRSIGSIQVID